VTNSQELGAGFYRPPPFESLRLLLIKVFWFFFSKKNFLLAWTTIPCDLTIDIRAEGGSFFFRGAQARKIPAFAGMTAGAVSLMVSLAVRPSVP
jgi:hypothetical protein